MFLAAATAFAVAILGTPVLIRFLRARGVGQQIRDDGPIEHPHVSKAGTPTMGGLAIVGACTAGISSLTCAPRRSRSRAPVSR
jgi:phospho-N-acetylmuramoyl-pentapeptide-transferase